VLQTFRAAPLDGPRDAIVRIGNVVSHGLPRIALWPFVALRPRCLRDGLASTSSRCSRRRSSRRCAWPGCCRATRRFQDAAEEVTARESAAARTTRRPISRSGDRLGPRTIGAGRSRIRVESGDADLARCRHPELAQAGGHSYRSDRRLVGVRPRERLPAVVGVFALAGAGFAVLMAPQILRVDLRQDSSTSSFSRPGRSRRQLSCAARSPGRAGC
jgi:hypothetical protein